MRFCCVNCVFRTVSKVLLSEVIAVVVVPVPVLSGSSAWLMMAFVPELSLRSTTLLPIK
jgi:hypothetical protein